MHIFCVLENAHSCMTCHTWWICTKECKRDFVVFGEWKRRESQYSANWTAYIFRKIFIKLVLNIFVLYFQVAVLIFQCACLSHKLLHSYFLLAIFVFCISLHFMELSYLNVHLLVGISGFFESGSALDKPIDFFFEAWKFILDVQQRKHKLT